MSWVVHDENDEPYECFGNYKPQCNTAYCPFMYKCEEEKLKND